MNVHTSRNRGIAPRVFASAGGIPRALQHSMPFAAGMGAAPEPNPREVVAQLASGFEEFKAAHNASLADIRAAIDGMASRNAGLLIGAGNADQADPIALRQAKAALSDFMRHGNAEGLAALTAGGPNARSMSSDSDPDGGYAVPKVIDTVIQSQMLDMSPIRRWANVVTTSTREYSKLVNRRGATSGWVGERQDRGTTDTPVLGMVTPPMGELFAQPEVTARLLEDSLFNLEAFLAENVSDEFAVQEGEAFATGDGDEKPRGFLTYTNVTTADETRAFGELQYVPSGVAAALTDGSNNGADKLIDMVTALRPGYRVGPNVGWMMNSTTAGVIRKLKDVDGRYLWQNALTVGQPDLLLGYPVAEDPFMRDIGANAFPIAFGNWRRGYTVVDRSELRLLRDPYTKKGWVRFYFTKRVGGAVTDFDAIKLLKIATT